MSDDLAEDQIAAFVDRILRLKAEADDIAADIKEIYAEAHANGLNKTRLGEIVTYLRKVEKDKDGVAEAEAIRDLYLEAYYRAKNKPHTHAYARGAEKASEGIAKFTSERGSFSPKTAPEEITEPRDPSPEGSAQMPTITEVAGLPASDGAATSPAGAEGIVDRQPIQPETANEAGDELVTSPVKAADHGTPVGTGNLATTDIPGGSNVAVPGAHQAEGEGANNAASATITQLRQPKPFRPNCLNRDKCGGQGPVECWQCTKAAAANRGATA